MSKKLINSGFEFKGHSFRPFSIQTAMLLERFESEGAGLTGTMEFLFVSKEDVKTLLRMDKESFDVAVLEFAANFTMQEMIEISESLKKEREEIFANQVEPTTNPEDEGKK